MPSDDQFETGMNPYRPVHGSILKEGSAGGFDWVRAAEQNGTVIEFLPLDESSTAYFWGRSAS